MTGDLFDIATNQAVVALGRAFTLNPRASGPAQTIAGVLEPGVEDEQIPPGEGSTYARLFVRAAALSPQPLEGDEIVSPADTGLGVSTAVKYRIVTLEYDGGGGLRMLLRIEGS